MANEKRKRSANWMASEKSLLVDLVTEHFHVIENKRTDGVSVKQKLGEWVTISNKYNSQTMLSHRTADNLKAQWESLKKSAKKEASIRRMHLIQTGGGPPRSVVEDPLQQKILCLITPSAVGLHNQFDSDNITLPVTDTVAGPEVENEYTSDSATPTVIVDSLLNENNVPVVLVPTSANKSPHPQAPISNNNNTSEATNTEYIVDWGDYTPKNLKTPISKPLQRSPEGNRRPTAAKRLEWMSKRRPQFSSSSLDQLNKLKEKAIATQMEHAAKEREEASQLFEIQMNIQREILKQEKIKNKLLLLELRRNKK